LLKVAIVTPLGSFPFRRIADEIAKVFAAHGWFTVVHHSDWPMFFKRYDRIVFINLTHSIAYGAARTMRVFNTKDLILYFVSESDKMHVDVRTANRVEKLVRRVATPSMFSFECMREQGLRVDDVVPHGFDSEYWCSEPSYAKEVREKFKGKRILFTNVANSRRKCIDKLFDVLARLLKHGIKDWVLLINTPPLGHYNVPKLIDDLSKYWGVELNKHIINVWEGKMRGGTPIDKIKAYYYAAHVYVQPSCNEGFGMPIVEAMLCKKPIVYVDAPPMNEIASPDFGYPVKYSEIKYDRMSYRTAIMFIPDMDDYYKVMEKVLTVDEDELIRRGIKARDRGRLYDYRRVYRYFVNPPEPDDRPKAYDIFRGVMVDVL